MLWEDPSAVIEGLQILPGVLILCRCMAGLSSWTSLRLSAYWWCATTATNDDLFQEMVLPMSSAMNTVRELAEPPDFSIIVPFPGGGSTALLRFWIP